MEAWQQLEQIIYNWVNPKDYFAGYGYITDSEDGSGDGILTFPEGLCEKMGWNEGDTLDFSFDEESQSIIVKKVAPTQLSFDFS